MSRPGMTLGQAVTAYVEYLTHEQHARRTTRIGYQSGLRRFCRFVSERLGRDPALDELTVEDVRAYLYSLSRRGLRPRTLRGAMYPLRGLFTLAVERGYLAQNPALTVRLPKKDAAVRATVSDEELERLLAGCERAPDRERGLMIRAVLAVLVYAGLRRQELLDLQISDFDAAEGKLLVRSGKGAKSRSVYVCRQCVQAVQDWLAVRPKAAHTYLFVTDRRRRLGEVGLTQLIGTAKSLADLRDHDNIKPHSIRHAAATRLLRNGADLRSIQQFLGHSDLQTTAVYLHTDEKQLQRVAEFTALKDRPQERAETARHTGPAGIPTARPRCQRTASRLRQAEKPGPTRTAARRRSVR